MGVMKICSVHRHGKRGKSTEQRSGSFFSGHGYSPRGGFPRIRGVGRHHLSQVLQCSSGVAGAERKSCSQTKCGELWIYEQLRHYLLATKLVEMASVLQ